MTIIQNVKVMHDGTPGQVYLSAGTGVFTTGVVERTVTIENPVVIKPIKDNWTFQVTFEQGGERGSLGRCSLTRTGQLYTFVRTLADHENE